MFRNVFRTKIGSFQGIYSQSKFKLHKTNNLMKKDFYKILGVSQKSTADEIKKSYFKLAKEWHPDVNKSPGAKEKFATISEAYDTLGDAEKRKAYDNYGITGDEQEQYSDFMKNMGGGKNPFNHGFEGNFSGEKGFQNFWDDIQDFFNEGQGTKKEEKRNKKGKDVTVNLEISFMEAINGVQKTIAYDRVSICGTCSGSKCKPGSSPSSCGNCGGSGKMNFKQGFMTIQMECSACNGEGFTIRNPCMNCYGKGHVNASVKETINIPKGVDENMNLRVSKKGHFSTSGQFGDLYVKIKVKPHSYFKRDNYDINTVNYINVSQAVLGGNIKVKTLYGDVSVFVEPGTNEGDTKKLLNYGIAKLPPNQHQKGNHYVKFKIKIPNKINEKVRKIYEEISKIEEPIEDNNKNL